MTKVESKIIDFFRQHILAMFVLAVTIAGIIMRISGLKFESLDYSNYLKPWWDEIAVNGLGSLNHQVGNYNIPYQIFIAIMTYLPIGPLMSYKLLSIVFDFVLAISASLLFKELEGKKDSYKPALIYGIVFCSVNVVLNSAYWAQCDSIYVAFILLAVYFIHKNKNIPAFVMLGIAFALKLQTVFIIPFFLLYYVMTKKCSILHFFIIPTVDILMCAPAFLFGRSFIDVVRVYIDQTDFYKKMQMNCANFYSIVCGTDIDTNLYEMIKKLAIMLTLAIIVAMFVYIIYKKADILNTKMFLLVIAWSVWTCVMFLPSMHERYSYLLDIIIVMLAFVSRKYAPVAVVCNLCTFRGYSFYLFTFHDVDFQFAGIVYIAAYVYFTYQLVKEIIEQTNHLAKEPVAISDKEYTVYKHFAVESNTAPVADTTEYEADIEGYPVDTEYDADEDTLEEIVITD